MLFAKTLALGASFVAAALAQSSKIGFTQQPSAVQAGVPFTLKWAGGDDSLVTITLQQGDANNLQTVSIITGKGTGNSYVWTPSSDLPIAQDYTLKISQGVSDVNYSGRFSLAGGSQSPTSAPVTTSALVTTSASVIKSVSSSVTPAATTLSVTAIRNTTVVATTAIPLNATTPILVGTAGTAASLGSTGIPISRNTTFSAATLTSTSSSAGSSSAAGSQSASASGSGSGSGSGSSTSSRATSAPSSAANLASPLAFVLSAMVAVIYLG